MLFKTIICLFVVGGILLHHSSSEAKKDAFDLNIKPGVASGELLSGFNPYLGYSLKYEPEWGRGNKSFKEDFWYRLELTADAEGNLFVNAQDNNKKNTLAIDSFFKIVFPYEDNSKMVWFNVGLDAKYETSQNWDDQSLVGGVELAFRNTNTYLIDNFARIPWLAINYDLVKPTQSNEPESLNADDSFSRLGVRFIWEFSLEKALGGLFFQFDYQYYKEYDRSTEWETAGFDQYDLMELTLFKQLDTEFAKKYWINNIFITFSDGRTVNNADDDKRVMIGIDLF